MRNDVIVEVDEYRHRGTSYKCEKKRMYDICAGLGFPCIFIRYNPDSKQSNLQTLLERIKFYLSEANKPFTQEDAELDEDELIKPLQPYNDNTNDNETEPKTKEEKEFIWQNYGFKVEYLFY